MTLLSWAIYIMGVVDNIPSVLSGIMWITGIACVVGFAATGGLTACVYEDLSDAEPYREARREVGVWIKRAGTVFAIALLVSPFIPRKDTMYAIIAIETADSIVSQPQVKQTMDKAFKVLNIKLDELANDYGLNGTDTTIEQPVKNDKQ